MAGFQVGKRVAVAALLAIVALGLIHQAAQAKETTAGQVVTYPVRPITVIVTFPPGGGTDLLARKLGPELEKTGSTRHH